MLRSPIHSFASDRRGRAISRRSAFGQFFDIGLISLLMSYAFRVGAAETETDHVRYDELEARGKQLRAAIQEKFQELVRTRRLNGFDIDITETVLPYFPTGISFTDAEATLRNGGFTVKYPDLNQSPNPNKEWKAVMGYISPFVQGFLSTTNVYVLLFPKSSGEYTVVEVVSAKFYLFNL